MAYPCTESATVRISNGHRLQSCNFGVFSVEHADHESVPFKNTIDLLLFLGVLEFALPLGQGIVCTIFIKKKSNSPRRSHLTEVQYYIYIIFLSQ